MYLRHNFYEHEQANTNLYKKLCSQLSVSMFQVCFLYFVYGSIAMVKSLPWSLYVF